MKALITGASSGIGKDIAIQLSKKGYDLILVAQNINRLNNVKSLINTNVEIICKDLSIVENCLYLYNNYKDIDLLVNNAGFGDFGEFYKTDLAKDLKMINTNITALHTLTKLYLKDMILKDSGIILNVASIAGFIPGPLMATYYSTKAYVVKLSEAIRQELKEKKSNVKISILCPGPVNTNFNNTANVKFKLNSISSEEVAKYTIKKLFENKFYIIPGFTIKLIKLISKFSSASLCAKVSYYIQKSKS